MKVYLYMTACTLICTTLFAQHGQSEISAGYGLFTTAGAMVRSDNAHSTRRSIGMTGSKRVHSGAFHVGYRYYDYKTQHLPIAIGGALLYEQAQSNAMFGSISAGRFDDYFYTLIGKMNLIWLSKGKLMLYGTVAAGATYCFRRFTTNDGMTDTAGALHLNFQLSPAGIKYGNHTGMFLEAGLGGKGTVCAGVFARF